MENVVLIMSHFLEIYRQTLGLSQVSLISLLCKRSHVCNFVDNKTLYSCNKNLPVIFQDLVCDLKNDLNWFAS